MKYSYHFICFYGVIFNYILPVYGFNCHLPEKCRIKRIPLPLNLNYNEHADKIVSAIVCDINDDSYEFEVKSSTPLITGDYCELGENDGINGMLNVLFRWTNKKESNILGKQWNFSNMFSYFDYFEYQTYMRFWGLKGFEINMLEGTDLTNNTLSGRIELSDCRLDFYHNKKRINSCQDLIDANLTAVGSIFQITGSISNFILKGVEYKHTICPLMFSNTFFFSLGIHDLVDTFYKKNVIKFSNETFDNLNFGVLVFALSNVLNINLDSSILHPSVFHITKYIYIATGSLNSIDGEIFRSISHFRSLSISGTILKKINQKQGIEWIRNLNYGLNVNLSNLTELIEKNEFMITILTPINQQRKRLSKVFPDEDFCIYLDFPFSQFVVIVETFNDNNSSNLNSDLTCTFLWLVQYYETYYMYYYQLNHTGSLNLLIPFLYFTEDFKGKISRCDFEKRISLCSKSHLELKKNIWDESDFFILNKKIEIAFKSSLYPISLLGLVTNFIVVLVILKKENSELFKEYKQYTYLYLNSIFCMMISVIELLSWMNECFYPFEVFCPEIRKIVAIQFFKIIFKECFVTMCRFMCNFTYIAFSLNRISLIGKDHGKLVTFMSELSVKKYILVTIFISSSLSWIKGFKFQVNYSHPDSMNFPLSNELDIIEYKPRFKDFYFTFNSISDLVNYFIFVIICVIIDICMVVQLRRTLEEKLRKSESLNQKQNQNKKAENEEIVNKAIKMVVLNSAIGILFKLPVCFIPLLNVYAEFYFKNQHYRVYHPGFADFYSMLIESGFYSLIQDISHLFFTLSLSIQMFIYKRFDKKFRTGYDNIKTKIKT